MTRRLAAPLFASALACSLVACSDDSGSSQPDTITVDPVDLEGAGALDGTVRSGVEYVLVEGAEPGTELQLVDGEDRPVGAFFAPLGDAGDTGTVDEEGLLAFGRVPAGGGYRVATADGAEVSEPVDVLARDAAPDQGFFDGQTLEEASTTSR